MFVSIMATSTNSIIHTQVSLRSSRMLRSVSRHINRNSERARLSMAGGSVDDYSWTETDDDVEVRVRVPMNTLASEVVFKVTPKTILLKLANEPAPRVNGTLRGKISMDGSYWYMETMATDRDIRCRLEKKTSYDGQQWFGVLDGESEVNATLNYDFDEKTEFSVEEYINYLGGYNESLVDKSMYSLDNITSGMVSKLKEQGLLTDSRDAPVDTSPGTSPKIKYPKPSPVESLSQEEKLGDEGLPIELERMTVVQLKEALRERRMGVGGNKAVLQERLRSVMNQSTDGGSSVQSSSVSVE